MSDPTPAGTFTRPMSAALARVLAQAADSAYAPPTFFVVARYEPAEPGTTTRPFDVQPPVATYAEAEQQVAALRVREPGVAYGIFGPFQNVHLDLLRTDQATVARFEVEPQRGGKPEKSFTIEGEEFDALFYSIQAVEKFVVPYYVQEYGIDFGKVVLDTFQRAPLALMGHLPWSEEVQVVDGPGGAAPPAAGAGARLATRTRYVPVFFEHGGDGALLPRRLYPPAADAA